MSLFLIILLSTLGGLVYVNIAKLYQHRVFKGLSAPQNSVDVFMSGLVGLLWPALLTFVIARVIGRTITIPAQMALGDNSYKARFQKFKLRQNKLLPQAKAEYVE